VLSRAVKVFSRAACALARQEPRPPYCRLKKYVAGLREFSQLKFALASA
jgi:hypothetical protein